MVPRKSRNRSCIGEIAGREESGEGLKTLGNVGSAAFVQDYRIPGGFRIDRDEKESVRGNVCRTRAGIY